MTDPLQWEFDPSLGFPTQQVLKSHSIPSNALQPSLDTKAESQQTMNPQFLNYHISLPSQVEMLTQSPSFENTLARNALGLGLDMDIRNDNMQQLRQLFAGMDSSYDGSEYAMQGKAVKGPYDNVQYQQQQPIPRQPLHHVVPGPITDSKIRLSLGLQTNTKPTPCVFHPHLPPPTIIPTIAPSADHSSLLRAAAAFTLSDNPAASSAKPPDPSLKLGKRRFVSLRVYNDGEAVFQRKVVR